MAKSDMTLNRRDFGVLAGGAVGAAVLPAGSQAIAQAIAVHKGPRKAFVIGNGNYRHVPELLNPVNDARAMTSVLRELDFEVNHFEDLEITGMRGAIREIAQRFSTGDVGLVYFAGHGVQMGGINYLLPIDIRLSRGEDIFDRSVTFNEFLDQSSRANVGIGIFVLDACRNNPFGDLKDGPKEGLASVQSGEGEIVVVYAAGAGKVAADGVGPNSPFTSALVSALAFPNLPLFDIFSRVRQMVRIATGGVQIPWMSASVERKFIFRPTSANQPSRSGPVTLASVAWSSIANSRDPADYEDFLKTHPDSPHVAEARDQLLVIEPGAPAPVDVTKAAALQTIKNPSSAEAVCDLLAADPHDPDRVGPGIHGAIVNTRLALRACTAAVAQDFLNPRLSFQLGRVLDLVERFEEAEFFYRRAREQSYPAASERLGVLYKWGKGRQQDHAEAAKYFREAAPKGHPRAQLNLGKAYLEGWGLEQSSEQAVLWFERSAAGGMSGAHDSLGNMYRRGLGIPKDVEQAVRQYKAAASMGSTNAMNNLGTLYREGKSVPRDYEEALRLFNEAAAGGNIFAPFNLGRMYRIGWGVKQDYARAREMYELSGERGFSGAMIELGEMYENGEGMPADLERAYYQYFLALAVVAKRSRGAPEQAKASEHLSAITDKLSERQRGDARRRAEAWLVLNGTSLRVARLFQ